MGKKSKIYSDLLCEVDIPGGTDKLFLEGSEYEAFQKDPEGYYAAMHGATKEDYETWLSVEGTARCGALTAKGSRCRKFMSGPIHLSLTDWLEADGGNCWQHSGLPSKEAN